MNTRAREPGIFAARARFWLLSGFLGGIGVAVLALLVLTQTRWGHQQVLEFTLHAVSEQLDGTLVVERLDGNLLTGARLYGISLTGPNDEPFVRADSAFVEYSMRTIAADEIVLDRILLYDAEIELRRMPGDTLWNYQRIFGDTLPEVEPTAPRRPLVIREARIVSSEVVMEFPWEPDPALSPTAQQREARAALSDASAILVREVPGGYLQTVRVLDLNADVSQLVNAPDDLGGTSLRVLAMRGGLQLVREPLPVQHLEGELSLQEGRLRFRAPQIRLPRSRMAAHGLLDLAQDDGVRMDVTIRADTLSFADLRPFYDRLPEDGGGSLSLIVETRPDGTLYLARDVDVAAPGTRVRGSFGMIMNEALRFVEVDLVADPLRVTTVEAMLPVELPVVGLRIGGVEIRQPAI